MPRAPDDVLPASFYSRDPALVARGLLGKRLLRRLNGEVLGGVLVETEAYYGSGDPASRAFQGLKEYNRLMWGEPGRVFIYNVHRYWMFNVVAHEPGEVGAVLVRALEPTRGIEAMMRNRRVANLFELTSGPGKLTLALGIDRGLNGASVTEKGGEVFIVEGDDDFEVGCSRRIGVREDLERDLRFYVKGSGYVSR
ncbi:MAG: DNA-3-methyladenine glycosylase [Candidatus Bathyarchaeota archaeon]|nr:MAG: DNA-3-methyladenine glycosylase [Candidatus Bathyarchaeota archaeon]